MLLARCPIWVWGLFGALAGWCALAGVPLALLPWGGSLYLGLWLAGGVFFAGAFALAGWLRRFLSPRFEFLAWPFAWVATSSIAGEVAHLPLTLSPALGLTHPEWLGVARAVGLGGVDLLIALPSALLACWARGVLPSLPAVSLLATSIAFLAAGPWIFPPRATGSVRVYAVQPVVTLGEAAGMQWSLAARARVERRYDALTEKALRESPGLVVWPEGGNELFNRRIPRRRTRIRQLLAGSESELLLAGKDLTPEGRLYSVVTRVTADGFQADARKARTVPVAESDLERGAPTTLETRFGRVGVAICFEAIFADHHRALVEQGAEVIAVVTDDSSFGDAPLTAWHLSLSVARAVEAGRALFLVGNGAAVFSTDLHGRTQALAWGERAPDIHRFDVPTSRTVVAADRGGRSALLLGGILVFYFGRRRQGGGPTARPRGGVGAGVSTAAGMLFLSAVVCVSIAAREHGKGPSGVLRDARSRHTGPVAPDGIAPAFRQREARTCGAAAISYLLTQFGDLVFEDDVLAALRPSDADAGYSLEELRLFAAVRGFSAQGFAGALSDLPRPGRPPVLAHLRSSHYVVVHDATADRVVYFDPEVGAVQYVAPDAFATGWSGALLTVRTLSEDDLRAREQAEIGGAWAIPPPGRSGGGSRP